MKQIFLLQTMADDKDNKDNKGEQHEMNEVNGNSEDVNIEIPSLCSNSKMKMNFSFVGFLWWASVIGLGPISLLDFFLKGGGECIQTTVFLVRIREHCCCGSPLVIEESFRMTVDYQSVQWGGTSVLWI